MMKELIILTIEQIQPDNEKASYHPVILKSDKEMVLVDCGFPGFLSQIKESAMAQNMDIANLTKVVITHQDLDHVGSLAALKRAYPSIKILAGIFEKPYINGEEEPIKAKKLREMYDSLPEGQKEMITAMQRMYSTYEPVDVDETLQDHDSFPWCGKVEIISTPGHTPGHISLYLHEFKTLIAGDALFLQDGELVISLPMFTFDMEQARQSVKKLLDYDINKIICYHGGIFEGDIKEALKKILMS
jgi:glyoxylase-like metal-dependent hydrolase (beta-lactamase superfamily II)